MERLFRRANTRISLGSAATLLISATLLGQALGFLRNRLISANFTQSFPGASDAFFVAFQIPDLFFYTITAGALGVAFIPFLSDRLEAGDKRGMWELASSLLNVLTVVMMIISVVILAFAEPLINALAPDLPAENRTQAVTIMRLISLNPLLFTLSGIITSIQQTFGRFFFYAVAPLFYNLSIIVSIYAFRGNIGIVGLGIGAFVGGIIQLLIVLPGLTGLNFRYYPKVKWRYSNFRRMLRQLPPRSLDQGIDQINSIVEVNRASTLAIGSVSNYIYALTLHNVPIMLIGNSIAIAAFPRLTERLSQNRPDLFRRDFIRVLQAMIWLIMPVLVVSYFARGYLARLIYGSVAPEVALIFGYLTVAILFRVIYSMLSRYFYAHKDTVTPLLISIFAIALNIYLAFTLARPDMYGIAGLALAQSIVAVVEVTILVILIVMRDKQIFNTEFLGGLLRIASATGFSMLAAFIMIGFLPLQVADRGIVTLGSKLAVISVITFSVYFMVSLLFGVEEAKPVLRKARRLVLKPIGVRW